MALASENGMEREQSSNRRIAKNTLALYVRMFLTMVVGLYTSRVVLATLGVEDYGVYGVVGGITSMLGFLNASMSGATSRFLTFELGRGDKKRLENTFSSAMIVHMGIAAVVLVLAETVGLWFLCHKLVIPPERMTAAHWVYQLSILSSMLAITQVPYNATIIAHENMNVYAYVEILNSVLKLLIVYLLTIGDFDKLILYAVLMLAVSVTVMMTYRIYCVRHYSEAHFHWVWDKTYLKPLLSFSGWNIYGNFGSIASSQGINFVINAFLGVAVNAAVGIATTVSGIVNMFASNAMMAFRPQITKLYAKGDVLEMQRLTRLAFKIISFLYLVVAIPVFLECEFILSVWLVKVPQYAVVLCQTILISIFFEILRYIVIINIHASGNVRFVSAASGTLLSLTPFALYVLFLAGYSVKYTYLFLAMTNLCLLVINLVILKHNIPAIKISAYCLEIFKMISVGIIVVVIALALKTMLNSGWTDFLVTTMFSVLLMTLLFVGLCLNSSQRVAVLDAIRSRLN